MFAFRTGSKFYNDRRFLLYILPYALFSRTVREKGMLKLLFYIIQTVLLLDLILTAVIIIKKKQ